MTSILTPPPGGAFFPDTGDQKAYQIGIVGATGAVGIELIRCLYERKFPVAQLRLFASEKSKGKTIFSDYGDLPIEEFSIEECRSCHIVFLAVSGEFALQFASKITMDNGPFVIDNSSAFRYTPEIPLVVPEINADVLQQGSKLIANPNCTTAIAAVALWPIHQKYQIKKMIVSTYQAASGAGAEGMAELLIETANELEHRPVTHRIFPHPLPFNLIPQIDKFQANGYTKEEMKVVWETLKIFNSTEDQLKISCTAVRIPTLRAHSEAITLETAQPINPNDVRELLKTAPGVRLVDDPLNAKYPMPLTATRSNDVEVGRIRQSLIFGEYGIDLFVSGDQLLRGAALNAVLIAEKLIKIAEI